jgi:hypothetical protein
MTGIALLLLLGLLRSNIGIVPPLIMAAYYWPGGNGGACRPSDNEAPNDGGVWYTRLLVRDLETKITEPKNVRNSIKAEKGRRKVRKREGKNVNGGKADEASMYLQHPRLSPIILFI